MTAAVETLLTVRRAMHIAAPPERVWEEFESFERFRAWFGTGHSVIKYEPRAGGWVEMEVDVEGKLERFGGRVTVFDPGRELTFEDNWIGDRAWPAPVLLTLRLTPVAGGTIVELIEHGFEAMGERAAEIQRGLEKGWSTRQLEALRVIVEGA